MALLIGIWYWTTTTWAAEVKEILAIFTVGRSELGFPLLGFWLTFMPQLVSSAFCVIGLCFRYGSSASKETFALWESGKSFWLVAGAAYWYGQFFTVQSLVFGTPALTFIVKSAEPLSTALLAVMVLRKALSLPLLLGIVVACVGVIVTVLSADSARGVNSTGPKNWQMAGMVFALLANLGFSSRACVAKKAISHLQMDPFETYGMMTIMGAQAGILPILTYGLTSHAISGAIWALPFFDPRFSVSSWFMMCLSYMLYQTCSVLILSSIAVESHALLVAMKHMLVVVLVSILVHANLTRGIVFGMALTALGVYIYTSSTKDNSSDAKDHGLQGLQEEADVLVPKGWPLHEVGSSRWQAPPVLSGIVFGVVLLGSITPPAIAAFGLGSSSAV